MIGFRRSDSRITLTGLPESTEAEIQEVGPGTGRPRNVPLSTTRGEVTLSGMKNESSYLLRFSVPNRNPLHLQVPSWLEERENEFGGPWKWALRVLRAGGGLLGGNAISFICLGFISYCLWWVVWNYLVLGSHG